MKNPRKLTIFVPRIRAWKTEEILLNCSEGRGVTAFNKLFVVDEDCSRRAEIAFELSRGGYAVLPLESPNELFTVPPEGAPILVHDNGKAVWTAKELARSHKCWSPLVAFDDVCDSDRVAAAVIGGARDYLIWPFTYTAVEKSIDRCRDYGDVVNWQTKYQDSLNKIRKLTEREIEVMSRVVDGWSSREIGELMEISSRTVESHRARILAKLGARGNSDAIRIWVEAETIM
jgi:two-component system, LuxR family, response regulator FixJ